MRKVVLLLASLLTWIGCALGQQRTVTGVVTSVEDGSPLIQLAVQIKGTQTGVVTDAEGRYTIRVAGSESVLVFTYTGYETQEITVGEQTTINVVMQLANEEIDQVVVVGYGSGRKASSTVGKLASVDQKDLRERPSANALEALGGKVAGLSVLTANGEPSQQATLTLHGHGSLTGGTSPLFVVDGIPVESIDGLNPADFERVDALTDAAATSIYGSRAANGVISITTKRGRVAEKGVVNVRYAQGVTNLATTDFFENAFNTKEYFQFYKSFAQELGDASSLASLEADEEKFGMNDFKWYKYIYNANSPVRQADVSVSGGTGSTSYYISGGYLYQMGLRYNSDYTRYTLRANVSTRVNSWLRVGSNTSLLFGEYHRNRAPRNGIIGLIGFVKPFYTPYDANGNEIEGIINKDDNIQGVFSRRFYEKIYTNWTQEPRVTTSNFIEIEPIKNLVWKTQGGVEAGVAHNYSRTKPNYPYKSRAGRASERMMWNALATITNTLEYRFTLDEVHHFTPLLGQEYIYGYYKDLYAEGNGQTDERLLLMTTATQGVKATSDWYEYFYNSFFGRLEYDYDNRYFAEVTLRNDASSRFGKNHQNAFFWAGGLMWKAKHEAFLRDVRWLDNLDVKFSIGTSGNSDLGSTSGYENNYMHRTQVGASAPYSTGSSLVFTNPGNPDLTWERQLKYSLGFNFGLFDIVSADLSFYRRETSDMFLEVPVSQATGVSTLFKNVGKMSNTGVDLRLDISAWKNRKGGHVTPYIVLNYNRNRIEELFDGKKFWIMEGTGVAWAVGKPVELFQPLFKGINPDNGDPEWYLPDEENPTNTRRDPSKVTNRFDSNLAQSSGKAQHAPFEGGFGLNASYWGFYLQADFIFEWGKNMINNDRFFMENPNVFYGENQSKELLKRSHWKQPGDNAYYPRADVQRWTNFDDRLIEDASFIRMKNFTFGYIVPRQWVAKTRFFSSAKAYMTLRNYLTFTNYSGADPEPSINLQLGANPNTKQILFGIDLTF